MLGPIQAFYKIGQAAKSGDLLGAADAVKDAVSDETIRGWIVSEWPGLEDDLPVVGQAIDAVELGVAVGELPLTWGIELIPGVGAPYGTIDVTIPNVTPPAEASPSPSNERVTAAAVWNPTDAAQRQLGQECGNAAPGAEYGDCVPRVMLANGASPEAVAFTASEGGYIYISGWDPSEPAFMKFGPVDVVRVVCTFATNFNCGYSYVLVNGSPKNIAVSIDDRNSPGFSDAPVDSDIPALWTKIRADPTYQAIIKSANTSIAQNVWEGEDVFVANHTESSGGQTLVFWSPIKIGHAGAPIGRIYVAYHFDPSGKFLGRTLDHVSRA